MLNKAIPFVILTLMVHPAYAKSAFFADNSARCAGYTWAIYKHPNLSPLDDPGEVKARAKMLASRLEAQAADAYGDKLLAQQTAKNAMDYADGLLKRGQFQDFSDATSVACSRGVLAGVIDIPPSSLPSTTTAEQLFEKGGSAPSVADNTAGNLTTPLSCSGNGSLTGCTNGITGLNMGSGTTAWSNGTFSHQNGPLYNDSNGVTGFTTGPTTMFSNGRTCTQVGAFTQCN